MTGANGRPERRRWVFRQFKPYALTVPVLTAIVIAIPILWLSTIYPPYTLYLLLFLLWPGVIFLFKYLDWWARRIEIEIADNGRKAITFKKGVWCNSKQPVPLSDFPVPTFRQNLLGRLLNYGDFDLSFLGGPGSLENVENYAALCKLVESRGEEEPERYRSPFVQAASGVWTVLCFIARATSWAWRVLRTTFRGIARGLDWTARMLPRSFHRQFGDLLEQWGSAVSSWILELPSSQTGVSPTYEGLLRFCDCELFQNGRRLDPSHLPDASSRVYFSILTITRVIVPENGYSTWMVSPRIRNIRDVQRRIDPELFERFIGQYSGNGMQN
jgi:hypothetical protein